MPLPKVSVIVPVFNSEKFMEDSLEALLKQTYTNLEFIVVDDGSSDSTVEIVKKFEGRGIKLVCQQNAGAAVARNTGLAHAGGQYIQFMDADDFLSNDKIEKQVIALNGAEDKLAVCNYVNFFEKPTAPEFDVVAAQQRFIFSSDDPAGFLVNLWGGNGPSDFIQTNSWLVPRKLIEKAGGWRNYRCPDDDGEFFSRVILAATGIIYVPGVINFYRRETNLHKLSGNKSGKYLRNILLTMDLKHHYLLNATNSVDMVNAAMAKQYLDFAVHHFPQHPLVSRIAYRRYKLIGHDSTLPLLGGRVIEFIKNIFGWKTARIIRHFLGRDN